mgnify:CR=1 FL=1
MAVFEYTVECIYETDKGSGKDYNNFDCKIQLARFREEGAGTHILRRFLPMLIRQWKNAPLFSKVKHWVITDSKKISEEFPLEGKDILKMTERECQELACMYDLFEVPLPTTMSISEMRKNTALAYLKKVLGVKMNTPEEKEQSAFFKYQPDGTLDLDMDGEPIEVIVLKNYGDKIVKEVKKKTLQDYINIAQNNTAIMPIDGVLKLSSSIDDGEGTEEFPSLAELQGA